MLSLRIAANEIARVLAVLREVEEGEHTRFERGDEPLLCEHSRGLRGGAHSVGDDS